MNSGQRFKWIATVAVLYALLTACTTWRSVLRPNTTPPAPNRGIAASHEIHAKEGMDCSDCHEVTTGERVAFVNHDTCMLCHEIPENSLTETASFIKDTSCTKCHTRNDYTVTPDRQLLTEEIKFDHQVHLSAEVNCSSCHENPDKPLPKTGQLMEQCMKCHAQTEVSFSGVAQSSETPQSFKANECSVCHKELSTETIPHHRNGRRIAHDKANIWTKTHGQEAAMDQAYCAQCHTDEQDDCMTCHRVMKPENHTLAWNRKLHGAHAQWDIQKCSVCHEEDSCVKCHKHTQPRSHRTNFLAPRNDHCVSCHVPAETGCTVCHESIEHRSAIRTPHDAGGGYTGNCAECHPGGIPGTAPHRINATLSCLACHE